MTSHRALLEEIYDVAIAAAHPRGLVEETVTRLLDVHPPPRRIAIIAIGKAAPAMAEAAVERLTLNDATIAGGIVIGSDDGPSPDPRILRIAGDHPVPGARSLRAAAMLDDATRHARTEADAALVLVSGGATSIVGAPVDGVTPETLTALFDSLLRSGWDIGAMNAVRKRFLRWGAGRLALALAPIPVHPANLSDVIGDDAGTIASGPCTPDPLTASDILRRLEELSVRDSLTKRSLTDHLERVVSGDISETPKPGHPAFSNVATPLIHGNTTAVSAAAAHARAAGWTVVISRSPLRGEATERGVEIAAALLAASARDSLCLIHSGETTVTMFADAAGEGGRCQELALAAARVLDGAYVSAPSIALLAAGTDGRDGSTDAAGAIIDRDTWRHARANGTAPERALATHDSHRALDAAGALLPARFTGTNVMDIVVGLVGDR